MEPRRRKGTEGRMPERANGRGEGKRRRRTATAAVLVFTGILTARLRAQQPPLPPAPKAIFYAQAQLVQVPVTVLDAKGHFIPGLQRSDFRLWVDGRPTRIAAIDVTRLLPPETAPPRAPAGAMTNQPETGARNRVVFLFDFLHMRRRDLPYLRERLLRLFARPLPAGVDAAVFNLSGGLQLEQPFTRDRARLSAAVERISGLPGLESASMSVSHDRRAGAGMQGVIVMPHRSLSGGESGSGMAAAEAMIRAHLAAVAGRMHEAMIRQQYYDSMDALALLARLLSGVSGHKEILWFTTNTSFAAVGNQNLALNGRQMQQALRLMNAANTSIFPIDPSGPAFRLGQMIEQTDSDHAARKTGGLQLAGNNAIEAIARTAMQYPQDQYVLYFKPRASRRSRPRYRRLKVQVRRQGARLLYRRGFMQAGLDFRRGHASKLRLGSLALSPMDWSGLPILIWPGKVSAPRAPYWRGAPAGERIREMPYTLAISARRLLHRRPDGRYAYDFSVATMMFSTADGEVRRMPVIDHYRRTLSARQAAALEAGRIRYQGRFVERAGVVTYGRAVVRDNIDGEIGTITVRIGAAGPGEAER